MKFQDLKRYQGQCFPHDFITADLDQKLNCMICYEIMVKPISLCCPSRHTFGMSCIKQWLNDKKENIICPYCRTPASNWQINQQLISQLSKIQCICNLCKQWKGQLSGIDKHRIKCKIYLKQMEKLLQQIVQQQIKQLDKEINPHLKSSHLKIYQQYVKDWKWLLDDERDWKWWWWCNNPWWHNQSCATCNNLWHKYQNKIDPLQAKRKILLSKIKLIQSLQNKQIKQQKKTEQN